MGTRCLAGSIDSCGPSCSSVSWHGNRNLERCPSGPDSHEAPVCSLAVSQRSLLNSLTPAKQIESRLRFHNLTDEKIDAVPRGLRHLVTLYNWASAIRTTGGRSFRNAMEPVGIAPPDAAYEVKCRRLGAGPAQSRTRRPNLAAAGLGQASMEVRLTYESLVASSRCVGVAPRRRKTAVND